MDIKSIFLDIFRGDKHWGKIWMSLLLSIIVVLAVSVYHAISYNLTLIGTYDKVISNGFIISVFCVSFLLFYSCSILVSIAFDNIRGVKERNESEKARIEAFEDAIRLLSPEKKAVLMLFEYMGANEDLLLKADASIVELNNSGILIEGKRICERQPGDAAEKKHMRISPKYLKAVYKLLFKRT